MDLEELAALDLYDPDDQHAELRLELLRFLIGLGATADDLVAYKDGLPGLAMILTVRGGQTMTLGEAAERSGLDTDEVRRLVRVAGFADPLPDAKVITEGFLGLLAGLNAAKDLFGEPALYQLIRVMGSAMSRVADACVSSFLVNVEPAARREDPVGLAVAKANVEGTALLPMVPAALDVLFRQHLLAAQRTVLADEDLVGYETQQLVVGFVDLVGSTELAEQVSISELGEVLATFENVSMDTVTNAGGRLVKLIGDEVLFTAPDAESACRIALAIASYCRDHDRLPEVRAGLAGGKVMMRDGDVFGPVVNMASRIANVAQPGEVLTTEEVAKAARVGHFAVTQHQLRGVSGEVALVGIGR